jgi:multiple sugar transport system substrate-binding protein
LTRALLSKIAAAFVALTCSAGLARAEEPPKEPAHLRVAIARIEGEDVAVLRRQVASFPASHPGVHVDVVADRERRTPTHDIWARYLALGDPSIDVYIIDEPWIEEFAFAGWIRPLDELAPWARADLHPAGLRSGLFRDHLYAVPMELSGNALFYRSDWLTGDGLRPPDTLEELLADARRLAEERHLHQGLVVHSMSLFNDINPFLWASGGGPMRDGRIELDGAVNLSVLAALRAEVGGVLPDASDLRGWRGWPNEYHTAVEPFAAGDAAFMINWLRYRPPGLVAGAYRVAPVPGLSGHPPGRGSTLGSWFLTVNASSKNAGLAVELVRALSAEQAAL